MLELSQIRSKIFLFYLYMKTDLARLELDECDIINNAISDHLCQTCAFLDTYTSDDNYYSILMKSPHFTDLVCLFDLVNEKYTVDFFKQTGFDNPILEDCQNAITKAKRWMRF